MTWRSESIPPVPEATAAAVKAAFPKGNLYIDLHEELGINYHPQSGWFECAPQRGAFV